MKMQKQHYEEIKHMIRRVDAGHPGFMATAAEYRERGLTAKRFRFDILHRCVSLNYICDVLYPDDTHIDTALKQIARDLTGDKQTWSSR